MFVGKQVRHGMAPLSNLSAQKPFPFARALHNQRAYAVKHPCLVNIGNIAGVGSMADLQADCSATGSLLRWTLCDAADLRGYVAAEHNMSPE
jgi:hypothetical protein